MPRKAALPVSSTAHPPKKAPAVEHIYELGLVGPSDPIYQLVIAYSFTLSYGTLTFWCPGSTGQQLARIHAPGTWTSVLEREP